METIGERVVRLREAKEWNQTDLAREARVAQSTVAGIESGARNKAPSSLIEIANALGVDAYWLKTGIGYPKGGRQITPDEETLLSGFSLADDVGRADMLSMAQRRIDAMLPKQKRG